MEATPCEPCKHAECCLCLVSSSRQGRVSRSRPLGPHTQVEGQVPARSMKVGGGSQRGGRQNRKRVGGHPRVGFPVHLPGRQQEKRAHDPAYKNSIKHQGQAILVPTGSFTTRVFKLPFPAILREREVPSPNCLTKAASS